MAHTGIDATTIQGATLTQYGQFYVAFSSRLMWEKGRKKEMFRYEGRYVGRRRDGLMSGCKVLDAWMHIQESRKEKKRKYPNILGLNFNFVLPCIIV